MIDLLNRLRVVKLPHFIDTILLEYTKIFKKLRKCWACSDKKLIFHEVIESLQKFPKYK